MQVDRYIRSPISSDEFGLFVSREYGAYTWATCWRRVTLVVVVEPAGAACDGPVASSRLGGGYCDVHDAHMGAECRGAECLDRGCVLGSWIYSSRVPWHVSRVR